MNIKKAINCLEDIKRKASSKEDFCHHDINDLLDFITPYHNARNKPFSILYRLLLKSRIDKLTDNEYKSLNEVLDEVKSFLQTEKKIETFLLWSSLFLISMIFIKYCFD